MDLEGSSGPGKRKFDKYESGWKAVTPNLSVLHVACIENEGQSDNEVDVNVLRGTVGKQRERIEDLCSELEDERNASSLAANEAMSMVLRFQGEKAEIRREARQFKRSAEKRMAHDQKEIFALKDEFKKMENYQEEVLALRDELKRREDDQNEILVLKDELKKIEDDQQEILALKDELKKMDRYRKAVLVLKEELKKMEYYPKEVLALEDKLKRKEQAIQSLTTEVQSHKHEISALKDELKKREDDRKVILALKDELKKNEQTIQSLTSEVQSHKHRMMESQQLQEDNEILVPQPGLVEGPQPLVEGPQPMEDNTSTVQNQAVDEPRASRFMWTIENFSRISQKKLYSDVFVVGGYKWRILIFPKGNKVDFLSMYLDVADSNALPYGWKRFVQFSLAVVNQIDKKNTIRKDTQCKSNQRESDWGFTSFMPLSELYDPNKGFLVNDTFILEADVAVRTTYTIIKVAREENLREQVGKDIYFDLVDHDKVHSFRIPKQMTFNLFKEEVAKEFGVPVEFQRFWIWVKRQNQTFRPNWPLTPHEETQTVGWLRDHFPMTPNAELKLFLEVELGQDLRPMPPPIRTKQDILLFFKLYDPHKEELRYVGRLFVKSFGKPSEILTVLNKMAGFASDEEIELFEEMRFEPNVLCERVDKHASFRFSQIADGDIICFQKQPKPETKQQLRFADVSSYLEYVKNLAVGS